MIDAIEIAKARASATHVGARGHLRRHGHELAERVEREAESLAPIGAVRDRVDVGPDEVSIPVCPKGGGRRGAEDAYRVGARRDSGLKLLGVIKIDVVAVAVAEAGGERDREDGGGDGERCSHGADTRGRAARRQAGRLSSGAREN